jgi:LysR family hydrogen peroxide-inducible transcriptional activator
MEACGEFARPAPPGRQGNSLETIRSMVASGLGVSVLPATALTGRHASPLVRAVDFAAPAPVRRVVAAFRADFPRRAAVQAMARAVSRLDLPVNPS